MITSGCSLSLSNERKRFMRRLPWFGASMRIYIRGYPVAYIPHTPAYTEKYKPCVLCGMFGARSSSGIDHNISRKECVTLVDAWGTCGARERCLGWWYRVMRRNTLSRTSREIEALLDHLDELGTTVQTNMRRRPVQRLGGEGGDVTYLSPFWEETARKQPLPGTYLTKPLVKCDGFGASLPTM